MIRALVAIVVLASCQASPAIEERAAAIVGGTIDLGDDAVVALIARTRPCGADPEAACTGTLIAPRAVLTAAHCVAGESASTMMVTFGPRVSNGERVEFDSIELHPGYDGVSADLAVLALSAPLAAPPLALRRTPIDSAHLDARVRMVGFGVGEDGLTGIKREGTARIAELTATTVVLAPDPALPCNADSGGPVLLGEEIAGVVAYGDPACTASGTSTRVDVHVDTFVAPALARIAASAPVSRHRSPQTRPRVPRARQPPTARAVRNASTVRAPSSEASTRHSVPRAATSKPAAARRASQDSIRPAGAWRPATTMRLAAAATRRAPAER